MAQGKRERPRATLLDSAAQIIASRGIAALSVKEVTANVSMANGTFYNYFRDKEEIVRQVALGAALRSAERFNEVVRDVDDARLRVARITWLALELATRDPAWGQVLIESLQALPEARREALRYLRQDLELGAEQGHFAFDDLDFLVDQCVALIVLGMQHHIDNGQQAQVTRRTCEGVLRIAGLTSKQATTIVDRAARMAAASSA